MGGEVPISHNALQHFPEYHGAAGGVPCQVQSGGTLPGPAGRGTLPGGVPWPGRYPPGGYPGWGGTLAGGVPWPGGTLARGVPWLGGVPS